MSLRVLCVGAGYFARFHYEAWTRHPGTILAAVADPDLDRARASGRPAFASLAAALEAGPYDIIDLIVPPAAQADLVREALASDAQAILCQKPFARSLEEAEDLCAAAESSDMPLIIHENFRFQPWYRKAKELLAAQALGNVHQLSFRLRTGDGQGPDAYMDRQPYFQTMPRLLVHETAVHWVDTFRYLMGPITGVYADLRQMNPAIAGEDAGHILFDFEGGRRALFDGNRHLDHATTNPRLTFGDALIEGTEATLSLAGDGSLTLRAFGETEGKVAYPPQVWPGFAGDCVYALQSHIVAAILGHGDFENEARDYLAVRRIEAAIYQSAEEGRHITL
ncbi:MAG: Gfo/Idh/MocA family oxidoreductase [Pseudomonadota bacterium]